MDFWRSLCVLAAACYLSTAQLLQPPAIINSPPATTMYFKPRAGDTVVLPCVATGNPKPDYQWKMNGQPFSIQPKVDGTIEFPSPTEVNEGTYQCFAMNSEGVAMSNTTRVLTAVQASFTGSTDPVKISARVGMQLTLPCQPTFRGVPLPRTIAKEYNWKTDENPVALTKRMQIDDNGNLNIAYVTSTDISSTVVWMCHIQNSYLVVEAGGSRTMIIPSSDPAEPAKPPAIMFYTNKTGNPDSKSSVVVGLEGGNVSMRCFFSGSDGITVKWKRIDGGEIPTDGRVLRLNFEIELRITMAQKSDEGRYACTGTPPTSGVASVDFEFSLIIHAAPKFVNPADGPRNYNATVGEYVKMNCSAYAIPATTIIWYKNGEQLDPKNPPSSKFLFSDDLTSLTVGPLCKDNCSGRNDLMVLQCNASNTYGYVLGNGYINVFVRTVFISKTDNITWDNQDEVSFKAKGVTDPNTPLVYTWYRRASPPQIDCGTGVEWCKVYNVTDSIVIINDDSTELTIYKPGRSSTGHYKCVASNGVSSDVIVFTLIDPPAVAYVWPYWWIPFIILLIVVLFIIIVLLVCCYLYRNRGDEYPVDEKERQADRNPEKELADSGFHDYQRPEGMQIATLQRPAGRFGPGSIDSSLGKLGSEDEMSLNDYASMNAGKFTEDGSFIGQYNPAMKRSRPVASPRSQQQPSDSLA